MKNVTIRGKEYTVNRFPKYVKHWEVDQVYRNQIVIGGLFEECDFYDCIVIGARVDNGALFGCKTYLSNFTDDTLLKNCTNIFSRINDGIISNSKNILCIVDRDTSFTEGNYG